MPFSRGSSLLRNQTQVSCIAGGFFTTEPPAKSYTCVLRNPRQAPPGSGSTHLKTGTTLSSLVTSWPASRAGV